MSYIDDTGDPEKVQSEVRPWPGYPDPQSFRIGMTPAVCNNWFAANDYHQESATCKRDTDKRAFRQEWTTTYAPRDSPYDIAMTMQTQGKKSWDRPWDIDTSDTSRQENGTWAWEIIHDYNGYDNQGNAIQYVVDSSHRVTLDNWTEWNAIAGAFLSHPDHLTRSDFADMPPDDVKEYNIGYFENLLDHGGDGPWKVFRRGDFLLRTQGMQDYVSLYQTSRHIGGKSDVGITLATSNPTAKAQDFSTGGFGHPVITMADNPFWRADPSEWPGIIENLKMDVLPYYAPTRKTRPVMYRFWEGEYSTALYGGPVFHCHITGLPKGDLSVANVPYYRKFLRDFVASDDTIMRWRDSIGLKPNEDARYPHNYANYWKVVQALRGQCNINGNNLWADDKFDGLTPTEWLFDGSYDNSAVGMWVQPEADGIGYGGGDVNRLLNKQNLVNHFVLRNTGEEVDALLGLAKLPAEDTTLAYPTTIQGDKDTKMSMYLKRKIHSTNMHRTNHQAFEDYYATFFNDGTDDVGDLSHRIHTETLGVVSDAGSMLAVKYMKHVLKRGDMNELLPDTIAEIDKDSITGWFNNELTQMVFQGLASMKSDGVQEFMKWSLEKGKPLLDELSQRLPAFLKSVHPKLEKLVEALEEAISKSDIAIVDGDSFVKFLVESFKDAMVALGTDVLAGLKDGVIEYAKKFKDWVSKPFFQPQAGSIYDKFAQMRGYPPSGYNPNYPFHGPTNAPVTNAAVDGAAVDAAIADGKVPVGKATTAATDVAADAAIGAGTAVEAAEALTVGSVMMELAPLVLLFVISDVLEYYAKKAEEEAEKAAAYSAAHDKQNKFYEAKVPLNTGFFNEDELERLKIAVLNPESPLSSIRELLALEEDDEGAAYGDDDSAITAPIHLLGLKDDETPWVRFDFLTKLIVMNYMSLSMVNKGWLEERDFDETELVNRLRQSEWLSTCEMIRIMRVVDHYIQAPVWADKDFSEHSFPITSLVPNGMIKEYMSPIPCVTPFDHFSSGLDATKDLYGLIFGDLESQAEVKREPSPLIPGKDVTKYDEAGSAFVIQVLPDDVEAQIADDMKRAGITDVLSRYELAWDANGNGYVVYYYFHGKKTPIVTPESLVWEKIIKDANYTGMYGQLPVPYVTYKEVTNVLTGLPMTVANIVEPVPIFAPDRSPTMFISSADPTYAWPTMRAQGGPMSYLAKELSYFETHKFDLTGEDGVDITTIPLEKTIGGNGTRLIVSRAPTLSIGSDKTVVVLTDSPEYTEAKWAAVVKALDITASIKFWRAHMDLSNVEWSKYDYPHPLRLLDLSNPAGVVYSVRPTPIVPADYDETNHAWALPPGPIRSGIIPEGGNYVGFDVYYVDQDGYMGQAIEYHYTLPDSFPDADYIFDFASKIDWAAFVKPSSNEDCGNTVTKYKYIVVSDGPFDTGNYNLFPLILRQLNGQPGLDKDYPVPPDLAPYADTIAKLCYWSANTPALPRSSETIGGITFTTLDGTGEFNIENMSALPIIMVKAYSDMSVDFSLSIEPGQAISTTRPTGTFTFVLKGEIEGFNKDDLMAFWKSTLFYNYVEGKGIVFGRIDRSLTMAVSGDDSVNLIVLDNPKNVSSPKMVKIRARLSQILGAIEGVDCYLILRYFILHQFPIISIKPASKLQEDACDWLLRHIKVDMNTEGGPPITPRKIGHQIGLFYVGNTLSTPEKFDDLFTRNYDSTSFFKKHPQFQAAATPCPSVGPYGPPTFPRGGSHFVSTMTIRDGANNPVQWAKKYAYLAFDEDPERSQLQLLLTSIGNMAHLDNIGNNVAHVDDVLNNKLNDLEALPKCKATSSQHDKLVGVLHMAERVRRLRVNALAKARSADEDGALSDLASTIGSELSTTELSEAGTANFLTMVANLDTIRKHRTLKSKALFYTLTNRQSICAQACKEVYKDERSGLRTSTSHYYFVQNLSDLETIFFFNPHNKDLLVACRGTDVKKDLEKADIDEAYVRAHSTNAPENVLSTLKRKFSAAFNPLSDLYTDFMIIVGKQGETFRHQNTLDNVKGVLAKYAVSSVTVTGHSLGGSIALFVHENLFGGGIKSQCVIFNGAIGLDQAYFDNVKATKAGKDIPWANAVTSFHVGGSSSSIFTADPVSFLTGGIGKSEEQFCITGTGVPDRLKAHTIGNFVTTHVELVAHETYTLPSKT